MFVESCSRKFRSKPNPPKPSSTGVPAAPKLTAVEFAIKARTTDKNGVNPKLTRRGAVKAAGVPKPATPSINEPKSQAMIITWILASGEIEDKKD